MNRLRNLVKRRAFTVWTFLLVGLILVGLVAAVKVFLQGLQVTNLTDLVPWGLWISIDLSSIALSAGAFLLSAAVYLLGKKELEPVARTAVFVGMIGYSMALMTLLLDIGRPDRFWHALAYWNYHSPLWEVTMCVALYFSVLLLEVMPIVGRATWFQVRWPKLSGWMRGVHRIAPILAIAGLLLSLLHQSSLGATYGILKARPVLYRPSMAVIFILSAMVAGPSMTVLASKISAYVSPKAVIDEHLLDKVSHAIGWGLVIYLYVRVWDVLAQLYTFEPGRTEGLQLLLRGPLSFNFWVGEIGLGIVVPMVLLLNGRFRRQGRVHTLALLLIVAGLVAHRWDTNIVGQLVVMNTNPFALTPVYTQYAPSLVEILAGAGVVAYGVLMFTLGVRFLKIVNHESVAQAQPVMVETVVMSGD
ncbi:MAG: polysulfide reductase NrfD [Chloroflexi bacterium]|nr:polysulfide reductase NrfD [Chloroflexota bacterium]